MSPDEIAAKWGDAKTHREKAVLEQELKDEMKAQTADLVLFLPKVSKYEVTARTRLLLSGSEYVWKLADEEGVELGTIKRILVKAERVSATKGVPLDEAVLSEFEDSQRGPRQVSAQARSWSLIRDSVSSILKKELSEVHETERQSLADDVMVELDVFIRQVKSKIRAHSKNGIPKDFGRADVEAGRKQFCADMRELGLDPPKPGKIPDMDVVRKTHRRIAGDHHPDRRKEPGAAEKFQLVNEAYSRILEFAELMKGTQGSSTKYTPPEEETTTSEKTAHCLKWLHDRKPGVRVSWRELIKTRENMANLPNASNALLKAATRNTFNIGKVMREKYRLDIDANKDGIRVLSSVEDKTKFSLAKKVKKMAAATKGVEENAKFILQDRASFKDTADSRALKKFAERASAAAATAKNQLPPPEEHTRYLTSGDD